jgi:hypothetical protein
MRYHLAELNIGRPVGTVDGPELADFVARLPEINALAERSPGFVWRLTADGTDDATALRLPGGAQPEPGSGGGEHPHRPPGGEDVMVNMSVWESVEALREYTYRTAHLEPLRRRREWFLPMQTNHLVLWWVPAGHRPTLEEARARLDRLDRYGPGPEAFTLRQPYPAPAVAPSG